MFMPADRNTWLSKGLEVLAEDGFQSLKVDILCRKLGLTKGSFYHHFKDRGHFMEELLAYWEADYTSRPIGLAEEGAGPLEMFEILSSVAAEVPKGPEIAIRTWAQFDPIARSYQERVDRRRLEYLETLIGGITNDPERSEVLASLVLAVYVGAHQVIPPFNQNQLRVVLDEIRERLL